MDFKKYIGKKVVLVAIPHLNLSGTVAGIVDLPLCDSFGESCSEPWMQITLYSDSEDLDGKTALVDCAMITCIVDES